MSKDGAFREDLKRTFTEIFENKNLVKQNRQTHRTDFLEVQYFAPNFWVESPHRDISICFKPNNRGNTLSERWERLHNHEYIIWFDNQPIGMVCRSPKRSYRAFAKPYDSREIFVDNAIRSSLSTFDNVRVSFEPGLAGEFI